MLPYFADFFYIEEIINMLICHRKYTKKHISVYYSDRICKFIDRKKNLQKKNYTKILQGKIIEIIFEKFIFQYI